ncbi:MAG: hypothetical protein GXP41_12605 [Chloroflexi bacterium]|nr:hypothetical protein [Chloroflexota bacterium]
MAFFKRFKGKEKKPRVVIIGLDGTPYSLLNRLIGEGRLPNMAALSGEGSLLRMNSVYPWVSSVAWSTFMTGVNPAKHGIFGFIDRDPATYKTFIPTGRHTKSPTLWEVLSQAGKRVFVMNIPVTFPPREVNGVLIAGFLCPTVDKVAYPPSVVPTLKQLGYRIDADPWLARESLEKMMADIEDALERRVEAMFHFWEQENWDFFMTLIMETDRLHHFYWGHMATDHPQWAPAFYRLYERIDAVIGEMRDRLDERTTLMLLSDHGFCSIQQEVYYNRWLADNGWLQYANTPPDPKKQLAEIAPQSVAYSMDPGRLFVRLRGREKEGVVEPGPAYERLRDELIASAEALRDPETGNPLVKKVYRREEIYDGPYLNQAADLIIAPMDGYDPKGRLYSETLLRTDPVMVGMHTYDDAFLYVGGRQVARQPVGIMDVMPTVLQLLDVPLPPNLDGQSLV